MEAGWITIERSLKGYRLKTPVRVALDKVLSLGSQKLAEYVISSLVCQRPRLIPWVLENRSLVELANYMLRAGSGSKMGFFGYTNTVSLYSHRLNTSPDQLIADVNSEGVPDLLRVEKHRGFLQQCINELQDANRSPGRIHGYARQIRTFYRVNGVELPKPKYLPRPRVVSKDRSPTQEELQKLLDMGSPRERVIVSLLALGGFREGTLSQLEIRHIKEDFEKNIAPVHVKIEADETKGQYGSYSTFLSAEAIEYIKVYLEQRKNGTADDGHGHMILPEELRDTSPLIRDSQSKRPRPIGEKQVYKLLHNLYHKAGLLRKNKNGGYELRVHSIRKFFKTQLISLGVGESYVDFWMGHVGDTYHDIEMKGVEFLRDLYAKAGLSIRPRTTSNKVDLLKQMARTVGASQDDIMTALKDLAEPHRIQTTPEQREDQTIQALTRLFVEKISDRLKRSPENPESPIIHG